MPSSARPVSNPEFGVELVREWTPENDPRAVMVLVHGHAEHSGRYERTGSLLAEAGILVRSYDLIGAGGSGGARWDIDDWNRYYDQLERHVEWARTTSLPVVLMGHSTGGTIALGYVLEKRPAPDLLVLSTPLIELRKTWRNLILPLASRLAPRVMVSAPTKYEELSRDPEVGKAYAADPLVVEGASFRFGKALLETMRHLRSSQDALDIPTLVVHGGMDKLVPPECTARLAELSMVERRLYPKLRHETLNEPEGPQVLADIIDWIDARI